MTRGLVLGGGGVTGIAWEVGLLCGLAESGVDLTDADLLVGTSAGSVVSAQLASGVPLDELFEAQLRPAEPQAGRFTYPMILRYMLAYALPGTGKRKRARLGAAALRARTVSEEERRRVFAGRISGAGWPDRRLLITAVDVADGSFHAFDRDSGVSLIDAVAASCAVPLVWPPVSINGSRFMDGGMRSPANADLAAGCERVVVVAPITRALSLSARPAVQAAKLGVPSVVLSPDAAALAAIGRDLLDPRRRAPAAEAGREQGRVVANQVRAVWM